MLEKYERLNLNAKVYFTNELNEIYFTKRRNINNFHRCIKELDILYDKGLLFIIKILYDFKKDRQFLNINMSYHFKGTINNLLVLYILGLSNVDPIKYKLPNELFNDTTINVYLINDIVDGLIYYVNDKYFDEVKFIYGNHDKEDIEEINILEDNHYLLIPFLGRNENSSHPILKDIPLRLNDYLLLETIEDYRKYKDEFLTIRIDEKKQISNYNEKGLVNVLTNDFEKMIAKIFKPKTIQDYIKIKSIGHGTDIWWGNQDILVKEGKINLDDIITSREDIFEYLLNHSIDKNKALEIVNFISKGHQKKYPKQWNKYVKTMKEHNCEDMFIDIFAKILFISGGGQAISECLFVLDNKNYVKNALNIN